MVKAVLLVTEFGRLSLVLLAGILLCYTVKPNAGEVVTVKVPGILPGDVMAPYIWFNHCEEQSRGALPKMMHRLARDGDYRFVRHPHHRSDMSNFFGARDQRLRWLRSGEVDLVMGSADFSRDPDLLKGQVPLLDAKVRLLLPKRLAHVNSLEQLRVLKGSYTGGPQSRLAEPLKRKGLKLNHATTSVELIEWLVDGQVDYIIAESRIAHYFLHKHQRRDEFFVSDIVRGDRLIYFYVRDESPYRELLSFVDQKLQSYRRAGLMDKLIYSGLEAWYSTPRSCLQPKV